MPRRPAQELLIGDALTRDRRKCRHEPALVIVLAGIEAERLFIEVAEQMERLDTHIGALDPALQEAPEVLNAVGMDIPAHVGFGVIDDLVAYSFPTCLYPPHSSE